VGLASLSLHLVEWKEADSRHQNIRGVGHGYTYLRRRWRVSTVYFYNLTQLSD